MINNLAKVIIAENGSIKDFEDTAFLVSNADEVNSIQMYVPDSIGSSLVQLSFKRADGFVISNRQMDFISILDPASGADVEVLTKLYEYQFKEDDRILDIAGQLQISALIKDGTKTLATPYFCLYIRKNIKPNLETKTEEEFYQEGLEIVEKAQIDINNHKADYGNPHKVRADQVPISNENQTLVSEKLEDISESINLSNNNISNLQQKDIELEQTIEQNANEAKDYTDKNTFQLQQNINVLFSEVQNLNGNKLNKIFNDIAIANNLAENDYFVLNSGNQAYRISVENMKSIFGGGGSDHYKGDFISYEELVETYPTAKSGDYAFVNVGSQMIMYVWDNSGEDETMQGFWRETTSGKYVLTTTFASFQEMLLDGSLIVDTAKNFDNGDGTKTNIKQTVDAFETKILDLEQIIEPIFTHMDNNSAIGTITDEQWLIIKNNQNVKLKTTIPISETSYVVAIGEKKNVLYNNGEINEIEFKSFLYGYIHLNIVVKPNLQVLVELKEYALAESLNIRTSNMDLIIGLSNEDSLIEKSIDLSPVIQAVVDENDVYIVNYDDVTTDSKVLNFLKNGKPNKILISSRNVLYSFQNSSSYTETDTFSYFAHVSIQFHNYLIKQDYIVLSKNKNTEEITIQQLAIYGRFSEESFLYKSSQIQINPATDGEITTGTNDTKAITPKGLKTYMDGLSFGYVVPTVYITDASLEYGTFSGDDLTNLQNDPNTIIYQANEDSTNDAYTILGETAGTRTFGNFKGNIVYKIEVNLTDGTWLKTNVDIVTQSEFNSTIGDINSILDSINGEVI
jgi:hypothetical protein